MFSGRERWDDLGRNDWESEKRHSGGFQDSTYNRLSKQFNIFSVINFEKSNLN